MKHTQLLLTIVLILYTSWIPSLAEETSDDWEVETSYCPAQKVFYGYE